MGRGETCDDIAADGPPSAARTTTVAASSAPVTGQSRGPNVPCAIRSDAVERWHERGATMDLGTFSVSLAVKDLEASKAFYEKLGFTPFFGDQVKNGDVDRAFGDVRAQHPDLQPVGRERPSTTHRRATERARPGGSVPRTRRRVRPASSSSTRGTRLVQHAASATPPDLDGRPCRTSTCGHRGADRAVL